MNRDKVRSENSNRPSVKSYVPLNNNPLYDTCVEWPANLDALLRKDTVSPEEQLNHTWSDQDHSTNLYILQQNPRVFHRHPVAQSTDAARGKQAYSQGLHMWRIVWSPSQRGTHALIGVGTAETPLHANGYVALLGGNNSHSWGWNISTTCLHHSGKTHGQYPSEKLQEIMRNNWETDTGGSNTNASTGGGGTDDASSTAANVESTRHSAAVGGRNTHSEIESNWVPQEIYVILDMNEGTLGYMVDGQFLGYAFTGLKGYHLYPMVSAVWGHCEIHLEYMNGMQPAPYSLLHSSRKCIRRHFEQIGRDLTAIDQLDLPLTLKNYLLYRYS